MRLFDFFYYSCLKNLKKYFYFEIKRIIRIIYAGPANPRDWERDRDLKPRDSRDRDENLRGSRGT